ncbi:hypothetical protein NEUTE2DRAFT_69479 [Neurospora tetrasperma FGSC 2509]|nr:hypothetical protein NEUTE2DRAFT_69479 [Neurospora tetrasperma FGSC 2509]
MDVCLQESSIIHQAKSVSQSATFFPFLPLSPSFPPLQHTNIPLYGKVITKVGGADRLQVDRTRRCKTHDNIPPDAVIGWRISHLDALHLKMRTPGITCHDFKLTCCED